MAPGGVTGRMADVVTLPVRTAASGARAVLDRTVDEVDDWGRDPDLVGRVWTWSHLRWQVTVGGHHHLPRRGGALVVVNARRFALAPVYAALAIGGEIGRPVRFVGRPDVAPLGPLVQRLGGLLPIDAELANVLRSGEVVVLGAAASGRGHATGAVDHRLVGAAVAAGVPAFAAVTCSSPVRRGARVEIGPEVPRRRRRRGPLAELELADDLRAAIDRMTGELGDPTGIWS